MSTVSCPNNELHLSGVRMRGYSEGDIAIAVLSVCPTL